MDFPIRLNKYLALKNIATRRGADKLIEDRKVFINGKVAVLGSQVKENDKVEVKGHKEIPYLYYAYNKGKGVLTNKDNEEDIDIKNSLKKAGVEDKVFPIGRLDKDSNGLIILTNDGRITDKLLNPDYYHEKEYVVKTKNKLRSNFKEKMEAGVILKGSGKVKDYKTKPCKVKVINDYTFNIVLTEGKKHQIRRMADALFAEVSELKRIRIMNIELKKLHANSLRKIEGKELEIFLKSLGL
jgi:23S rRNA pseudouridine2604 synthase